MGFDPRRWRPSTAGRPITANVEALLAENDALKREVRSLRLQLELLLGGAGPATASQEPRVREPQPSQTPPRREAPGERVTRSRSHGLSAALVERWSEAMARHPRWPALRLGPPAGLRGLLEELHGRAWNPQLSLEQELDRRSPGLGSELMAALRGPHSRGRLAVRAAFAFYGPRAIEWLSEEPLRVVDDLLGQVERLERAPGRHRTEAGSDGRRRGTRTANHSTANHGSGTRTESRRSAGNSRGRPEDPGAGAPRSQAHAKAAGSDPRQGPHTASQQAEAGRRRGDRPGAEAGAAADREQQRSRNRTSGHRSAPASTDPIHQALALLGLEPGASLPQIKRAYRRLAKAHHPDLGGDVAAFHRLDAAYRLLL